MKCLFLLLSALVCLTVSSNQVRACTCGEYGVPVCAKYWRSDAVFVGRLSDLTPPEPASPSMPVATLHFVVEEPFRGVTTTTVDVENVVWTSCDMPFIKGRSYLVYANRDTFSHRLVTGICMGTDDVRNLDNDLIYLRSLMQQGVTESINGLLARMRYEPISGAKIEVRNGKKNFEAASDDKGRFSVSVDGPGTYTVRLLIPTSVRLPPAQTDRGEKLESSDTLTTIEYKVQLGKAQCDYRQFDLFPEYLDETAKISGVVLDASGRAVRKGAVYLTTDGGRFKSAELDANGSFNFEKIPGGKYFLVLNPDNIAPGPSDAPYPRTFYPHAPDSSGAAEIIIPQGATLDNLMLRVGPPLRTRVVSGRVVWRDETPPTKVYLSLDEDERFVRSIDVDKNGRFSVKVYGDFKYVLEARGSSEGRYGRSERVPITEKSTNLKLILKPK